MKAFFTIQIAISASVVVLQSNEKRRVYLIFDNLFSAVYFFMGLIFAPFGIFFSIERYCGST
jgi:hypothetical protein